MSFAACAGISFPGKCALMKHSNFSGIIIKNRGFVSRCSPFFCAAVEKKEIFLSPSLGIATNLFTSEENEGTKQNKNGRQKFFKKFRNLPKEK